MTVKVEIALTDAQLAQAQELVAIGRYPSLDAMVQEGLAQVLQDQADAKTALRDLLEERRKEPFLSADEFRAATAQLFTRVRAENGL